jgi:hypothetical protein
LSHLLHSIPFRCKLSFHFKPKKSEGYTIHLKNNLHFRRIFLA